MKAVNQCLHFDGFGASFYPEQQPEEAILPYIERMKEAGIKFVRMGEFAWDKMEPAEDQFDFSWLDKVMDMLAERGIRTILGTPTAVPPIWLAEKYPEILPVRADRHVFKAGHRRYTCLSSGKLQERSLKIVRAMGEHYKDDLRIHSWQIDNEAGHPFCYCERCRREFQKYAEARFGSIKEFNDKMQTHFWGQSYQNFQQILMPIDHGSPSMKQLFHQFFSDMAVKFYHRHIQELHDCGVTAPISTNMMLTYWGYDHREMQKKLDYVCGDHYFSNNIMGADFAGDAYLAAYLRGIKPETNIRYAEFQCSKDHAWSYVPLPGKISGEALAHIAMGADHICFFRWDSCLSGAERDEYALLSNPEMPGRVFYELKDAAEKLEKWAPLLEGSVVPRSQVGFLYTYPTQYDLGENPPCPEIGAKYENGYPALMCRSFRALLKNGITSDIVFPDQDFEPYKVLILSTCYCMSKELAEKISKYVQDGGKLVVLPLTGIADELSVLPLTPAPLGLTDVCGLKIVDRGRYNEVMGELFFQPDPEKMQLRKLPVTRYVDELLPDEDTEILARFDGKFHSGIPAMTRHRFGNGTAYYIGTWFESDEDMKDLYNLLADLLGLQREKLELPAGVYAMRRVKENTDLLFLINSTSEEQTLKDPAGNQISLKPFEVRLTDF